MTTRDLSLSLSLSISVRSGSTSYRVYGNGYRTERKTRTFTKYHHLLSTGLLSLGSSTHRTTTRLCITVHLLLALSWEIKKGQENKLLSTIQYFSHSSTHFLVRADRVPVSQFPPDSMHYSPSLAEIPRTTATDQCRQVHRRPGRAFAVRSGSATRLWHRRVAPPFAFPESHSARTPFD